MTDEPWLLDFRCWACRHGAHEACDWLRGCECLGRPDHDDCLPPTDEDRA